MRIALALLAVLASGATTVAQAQDFGGTYSVSGTNFDGSPYTGTVQITQTSDSTCTIVWNTGSSSTGICMRSGGVLAASYTFAGGGSGLVIYEFGRAGELNGVWTQAGVKGTGTEILKRQ